MDFSLSEVDDKSGTGGIKADILKPTSGSGNIDKAQHQETHGGHSPTKLIDISGSTDDFEHVYHDDPLTVSTGKSSNITEKIAPAAAGVAGMMEEFLGTTKTSFDNVKNDTLNKFQNSSSDLMQNLESNLDKKINQTIDFMNAERGGNVGGGCDLKNIEGNIGKPTTIPPSSDNSSYSDAFTSLQNPPPPSSYDFDYQKEHYNPSPIKKSLKKEDDEKFISSEDLLSDFKDERMSTPEHKLLSSESATVPGSKSTVTSNILQQHSGIEDLSIDNDSITATVKDDITKISGLGQKIKKPEKIDETISATKTKSSSTIEPKNPSSVESGVVTDKTKKLEPASSKQMISAEEIFYRFGLDTWFKPESLHPKVESLIYWRDVKKSGIVFGAGLIILLAISCFSVISVFAYLSLIALGCTILFRIYKTVMGAVQKTSEGHPFKEYLEMDLNLPHEKVQQIVNVSVAHVNGFVSELRRLFLVEDLVDSIKFGVILWILTYVGAWFNGMTLVILAFVSLFTLPKVYENNKQSIDTYLDLVRSKILEITDKVKAAVPIGKKPETDKDK